MLLAQSFSENSNQLEIAQVVRKSVGWNTSRIHISSGWGTGIIWLKRVTHLVGSNESCASSVGSKWALWLKKMNHLDAKVFKWISWRTSRLPSGFENMLGFSKISPAYFLFLERFWVVLEHLKAMMQNVSWDSWGQNQFRHLDILEILKIGVSRHS